ncbi:MAG TPA: hypothetical protein PK909_00910 [Sphaerochaeta sp.]|jgi:beta-galactosidase beta subunit|nr:hypothetical protein [Sphaerochaeta sp.]HQB54005.1 hypothetical protein [Sphaerochaeta sp.]
MIYDTLDSLARYTHLFGMTEPVYETIHPKPFDGMFIAHSHYATIFLVKEGEILVCSTHAQQPSTFVRDINGFVHLESSGITSTARVDSDHFIFFSPYEPYALIAEKQADVARLLVEVR